MQITVAKIDLEEALSVSRSTVGNGTDLSSHYLFRKCESGVEILSYDMRMFSRAPLKCEFSGDTSFTVEAWRLDKWVSGVADTSLTITLGENGEVTAKGSKGKVRLRSLDPNKFPYWDKLYQTANSYGTIAPATLAHAFSMAKGFVSDDETQKPELCQIETVDGVMRATDRRGLSSISIDSMANLNLRVSGRDISPVLKFLSLKETGLGSVDVLFAERPSGEGGGSSAFIRRLDGAYIGITRPLADFPKLNVRTEDDDEASFELNIADFKSAISVLSASAPKGHESIKLRYLDGRVFASMPSDAGGEDNYPLTVNGDILNGEVFESGFVVDYSYILGLAESFKTDVLKLGVNKRGKGGFVCARYTDKPEDGGNKYYAAIVWKT